jgi:hypothetical protein
MLARDDLRSDKLLAETLFECVAAGARDEAILNGIARYAPPARFEDAISVLQYIGDSDAQIICLATFWNEIPVEKQRDIASCFWSRLERHGSAEFCVKFLGALPAPERTEWLTKTWQTLENRNLAEYELRYVFELAELAHCDVKVEFLNRMLDLGRRTNDHYVQVSALAALARNRNIKDWEEIVRRAADITKGLDSYSIWSALRKIIPFAVQQDRDVLLQVALRRFRQNPDAFALSEVWQSLPEEERHKYTPLWLQKCRRMRKIE